LIAIYLRNVLFLVGFHLGFHPFLVGFYLLLIGSYFSSYFGFHPFSHDIHSGQQAFHNLVW
jgi:hypothetical protein